MNPSSLSVLCSRLDRVPGVLSLRASFDERALVTIRVLWDDASMRAAIARILPGRRCKLDVVRMTPRQAAEYEAVLATVRMRTKRNHDRARQAQQQSGGWGATGRRNGQSATIKEASRVL